VQEHLTALLAKAALELQAVRARPELEAAKARYVGPNGELTALMKQMGAVPKEERPALGRLVNEAKARSSRSSSTRRLARIDRGRARRPARAAARSRRCRRRDPGPGTFHPLTLVREELCRILRKVGFAWPTAPRSRRSSTASTPSTRRPTTRLGTPRTRSISRGRPLRERLQAHARRALSAAHPHLFRAGPHDAERGRRRSGSSRRGGSTGATPPTPRTAPIFTSSSASTWTAT
jgi:hypothetical protein